MKNRILFWIDAEFKHFAIAKILQEKLDADFYVIYDLNHHFKKVFKNQKMVNFKKEWFYWDNFQNKITAPDIEYLINFEKKYRINLWQLVYGERLFYQYNQFYKFNRTEILSILEKDCKFFESVLDEVKPEFLLNKVTDFHRNHLLAELCKAKGIKVLTTMPTRLGYRSRIGSELQKKDEFWKDVNESKKFQTFSELREYIKKFDRYKQTHQQKSGGLGYPVWKKIIPSIKWAFKTFDEEYRKQYDHYGVTRSKVLIIKIMYDIKRILRKRFIDKNASKTITHEEKFVFFPLQVEPERTVGFDAPYYSDQLNVIKNVARSLPVDMKLYVKEHFNMKFRSWRKIQFYKEILNLPNVQLIHPLVDPNEILEKCMMVITINSTAGLEAAFHGKPSIIFSDTTYSDLSSVIKIKRLDDLPIIINKALQMKVNLEDISRFVNLLEKNSFEFDDFGFTNEILEKFHMDGFMINEDISLSKLSEFIEKKRHELEILVNKHIEIISGK